MSSPDVHLRPALRVHRRLAAKLLATNLLAAGLFATTALAQQPPTAAGPGAVPRDTTIRLDVAITPKARAAEHPLHQQDFTLLDNKSPVSLVSFRAMTGTSQPVRLIVVVDAVNTSYTMIGYERSQLSKFFQANGGHLAYPTSLAILTDKGAQMQQGFSQDGKAENDSLNGYTIGLRDIRRSEGIYGADDRLGLSLKALQSIVSRAASLPGRKLILWISPGWPILSGPGIQLSSHQQDQLFASAVSFSGQLRHAQVTLYAIDPIGATEGVARQMYYQTYLKAPNKPGDVNIGNLSLQVLAAQSGGLVLNSSDVGGMLKQCISDADAYYELSFKPASPEQHLEYHHLEVKLSQAGLTARTRDGYYVQP